MSDRDDTAPSPEDEVAGICADLIRFGSVNYGDGSGPGERKAAEYVMEQLTEVGLDPEIVETEPGRASVMVLIEGQNTSRPGLALHGHLDVVPAHAEDWDVDPFSGEERDGCIWGRGAVDMLDMDAMIIANLRRLARTGEKPARTTTFVFFADEEAGGLQGSRWLVENRPDWFEGVTEAVSEVGGFSVTVPRATTGEPARAYLVQTAEKGIVWLRLHARGRAGHGSVPTDANAVVRLAEALSRIAAYPWPREYIASVQALLDGISDITGTPYAPEDPSPVMRHLRHSAGFVAGTLTDTAIPTMLDAGYKMNVVPQKASASVDCRYLPGHKEHVLAKVRELAGEHVEVVVDHTDIALDAPLTGDLVTAMTQSLLVEDPEATVLPYCLSGGTDNKALSRLGIIGYGFVPLRLPPDLEFAPMFHGINERVPVDSLQFGTRVLAEFLRRA